MACRDPFRQRMHGANEERKKEVLMDERADDGGENARREQMPPAQ